MNTILFLIGVGNLYALHLAPHVWEEEQQKNKANPLYQPNYFVALILPSFVTLGYIAVLFTILGGN